MKKIILALGLLSLVSCNLDRFPNDLVTADELKSNPQALEVITRGNYALFKQSSYDNGMMRNQHCVGEYGGDNVSLSGSSNDDLVKHYNFNRIPDNSRSEFIWRHGYQIINGTIQVISATETKVNSLSAKDKHMLGENLYLRALSYFYLVNTFAKPYTVDANALGVPIKNEVDLTILPKRATVREVYDLILSDLKKAEQYMSINNTNIYATKEAAQALLSRVYLYMDKNTEAIQYADKVINSGKYTLLEGEAYTKYPTFRPEDNTETIFAIKHTKESDMTYEISWGEIGSMYGVFDQNGWGEIYASFPYISYVNKEDNDLRKKFLVPQYKLDDNGEQIPAIYWVENNNYKFLKTYDIAGEAHVKISNTDVKVESDIDSFYFVHNGVRTNVTYDHLMQERYGFPQFYVNKCVGQEGQSLLWSPVVSRLAEIYLNRAEAKAKTNDTQGALDDLNVIRRRAGVSEITSVPAGKTLLQVILDERGIELAFEAHRKYDIFRNKMDLNRNYPGFHNKEIIKYDEARIIEFIPQSQTLVQPNLIQNPF